MISPVGFLRRTYQHRIIVPLLEQNRITEMAERRLSVADEIENELGATSEEVSVVIDGKKLEGWQIAKPLNYDKEYTTQK